MNDRTYAFLFTDIEGSTRLWEERSDAMRADLRRHNAILNGVVEAHGGRVFKMWGDSVYAAFDESAQAVAAALEGQTALAKESWTVPGGIRVRMAVHKGEAERSDGDFLGPTLNRVARLLSTCHGGQVVLSDEVVAENALPPGASVKDLGKHSLRDLRGPMGIRQLMHPNLKADFPELSTPENQRNPTVSSLTGRVFPCFPVAVLAVIVDSDARILLLSHPKRGIGVISGGMEANETVLQAVMRETAEEAGFAMKVRPLGIAHASSFAFDSRIRFMLDVYFVVAYEGGKVVPSDDMSGAEVLWRSVDEIVEQRLRLSYPPTGIPILSRAVELWRRWKDAPNYLLEPWMPGQSPSA